MNFRSEKGSITVYVLVAVFFLLAIIAGRFVIANRNLKVQYDALAKVKAVYESSNKQYPIYVENPEPDNPDGTINHEIYIFNEEAFNFFNNPSSVKRFYVYQSDIWYISDDSQSKAETKNREISLTNTETYNFKYKLMSDIKVTSSNASEDNRSSVANSTVCKNLDFNNHIIYTNETSEYSWLWGTTNYENYVFFSNGKPTIGRVEK